MLEAPTLPSRWQPILACIMGNLLLRLGNSATGVLLGLLLASMSREGSDVRPLAIGMLAVSFYATELIGAPIFGALSDQHGRRRYMIAGPILGGIAIQLIGWPAGVLAWPIVLVPMIVGRMLEGLSTATSTPATLSFLTRETAESAPLRSQVMAWYEVATVVGIGGGFVTAGVLWDRIGFGAFLVVTLIYASSCLSFWYVHDRPPRVIPNPSPAPPAEPPAAIFALLRRPRVLRFVPAWLAVNTIIGVWFTHSAFQLTGGRHEGQYLAGSFSGTSLGLAFVVFGGAFVVGVWLWGLIMGTRSRTLIMLITVFGFYLVCGGLCALNHIPPQGGPPHWPWTGTFLVGVVLLSGFTPAALAYLADLSEETARQRGAVMGLYSVVLGLGQMIGGTVGSPFAAASGVDGLILLTALLASAALVTVVLLRSFDARELRVSVASGPG